MKKVLEGLRVIEDLVGVSDVFLHNFSPGALKAFGLTYEDMKAIKPDIIYAGISCYGGTGEGRQWIARCFRQR